MLGASKENDEKETISIQLVMQELQAVRAQVNKLEEVQVRILFSKFK